MANIAYYRIETIPIPFNISFYELWAKFNFFKKNPIRKIIKPKRQKTNNFLNLIKLLVLNFYYNTQI